MAEEIQVPVQDPQPTPYIDKVYSALKDNLQGFNKTPEQFKTSMQDSAYAAKAYSALKDNLTGFNKSEDDFYSQVGVPKKAGGAGSPLTSNQLPTGLKDFQSSQANTPYSGITTTPQMQQQLVAQDEQVRQQRQSQHEALSNQLSAYTSKLSPKEQAALSNGTINSIVAHNNEQLSAPTKEEIDAYNFSQTPTGKIVNGAKYLGQKVTKGGLQVTKGAAYLADIGAKLQTPTTALNAFDGSPEIDKGFEKADKATDFLSKGDVSRVEDSKVMANLGGLAEFLPSAIAGESTGGATFYLQGLGQGKETIEQAEKNGVKINPVVKNAFILGTGAVNGLLMGDLGKGIFKPLASALKDDVVANITTNAIKDAAGKDLTAEGFKNLLQKGAQEWTDKALQGGANYLKNTKKAVVDLSALNVGNFALKQGVDAVNEAPVFNENLGNLAEQEGETLKAAPMFGAIGSMHDLSKLTPYSSYKNAIVDNLMQDSSPENITKTKEFIAKHGEQQGWTPEQIQATNGHIDQIGAVTKSLPKGLPDAKIEPAVDLVLGRNELQEQLTKEQENRKQLDPALNEEPTAHEQFLTDKIEQANDKLRDVAKDTKTTYAQERDDNGDYTGKFVKNVWDKKENKVLSSEEITESRYNLERAERDAKAKPPENNEQTEPNQEVPIEQPTNKTGQTQEAIASVNEGVENNLTINPNSNEKVNETNCTEASIKRSEETVPTEKEEVKSGAAETKAEITVIEVKVNPITYKGEPAEIIQDGQTLVAKIKGSNREYELGNVDEVGDKSIKELGIEHENSVVDTHENGNVIVRDKEYVNNYSDPKSAINYDKNGNVVSVNLETPDGAKRTFKGDVAEDIAYQIHLKELNKDNESKQQFEQFVEQHEPSKSTIVAGENEVAAEKATVKDNATVSRKPTVKKPKVVKAEEPIIKPIAKAEKKAVPVKEIKAEAPKEPTEQSKTEKSSLSDEKLQRKLELRKQFTGRFNDVTNIPTLLANKEFREYAGLVLEEAAGDFKQFSKELIDNLGEKVKEHLTQLYKDLGGDEKQGAKEMPSKDEKATYGTKNSVTEALRDGMGMPPIEIPKDRSEDASLNAWKNGTRTPIDIIGDLLNEKTDIYDKSITPNDEPIMREYIKQLGEQGIELNKVKAHMQETGASPEDIASVDQQLQNHYDQMERALNASKLGGNIWHKYGAERQLAIDEKGLVLNSIERIKSIYGNDIPTEIKQQLRDLQAQYDNLLAKNANIEAKLKAKGAEQAFEKVKPKKTIFGTKRKTEVEFKKERADIVEQMKRDLKKSLGQLNATLPGVPQLNAIAPHVAKLMRSFAEQGIVKLDDAIEKVHDIVKDVVDGISKDDIRDIMAGRYSEKKPLSDLQKELNDLRTQARNKVKIEQLEKGIAVETKKRGEASPEVKALQKQVADLKKTASNEHVDLSIQDLKSQIKTIQTKIDKGEYFKMPIVKRQWETNPEWVKNNKEKANLNFKLRQMEREALDSQKGKLMRALDWTNRWGRRVIFFGANAVYTKLASAAVLGSFVHRLPEQGLGKLNAKLFPHIAKNAPMEGATNATAEAKFYSEFLNPKTFLKNTKDILLTGETGLSKELGKHLPSNHIPILDLFAADAHIMIKDPVKRATFEASLINHLNWYEQNGVDPTHPLMLESARQAAYKRAEYEIFQNSDPNSNKIKRFFNELEKSAIIDRSQPDIWNKVQGNAKYTAAAIYHFMIPINTVPVNILKRVGLGLKLPVTFLKAMAQNKAVKEGILKMTTEQSDAILLQLKKGQIGAAYWTLGFILAGSAAGGLYTNFYSDKEREKTVTDPDADFLQLLNTQIPKDVQHNTQMQALQMGATWGVVYNHYIDDKGESQLMSIFAATAATAGTAAKQHPVINVASNVNEAIQTPHGNTKFTKDLKRRVGITKATDLLKLMGYDTGIGDE